MVARCLLFSCAVVVAAAEDVACSATGGQCGAPQLAKEHQLLQFGSAKVSASSASNELERGLRHAIPGQVNDGTCTGMQDVEKTCSYDGCKVLATNMLHKTCAEYCTANGRNCVSAAEEVDETCAAAHEMNCGQTWHHTSDLLCQCSPSGVRPEVPPSPTPASDPSNLELVWAEEFNGNHVDSSKWSFIRGGGGFGNQELQYYSSRSTNAEVGGGSLKITAKCDEYKGHHFTSAKLQTKQKGDWGPGHRVEVRARMPKGKGTWPAVWMLPTTQAYGGWPRSGEIDIMEGVGCTDNKVYGTVHTEAYNHMLHTEKTNNMITEVGDWHVYTIDWTATQISWFVDGHLFHRFAPVDHSQPKWPYDQQFYLILNIAVGGSWGGYCLHRPPSCQSAQEFGQDQVMEVDYARVYRL